MVSSSSITSSTTTRSPRRRSRKPAKTSTEPSCRAGVAVVIDVLVVQELQRTPRGRARSGLAKRSASAPGVCISAFRSFGFFGIASKMRPGISSRIGGLAGPLAGRRRDRQRSAAMEPAAGPRSPAVAATGIERRSRGMTDDSTSDPADAIHPAADIELSSALTDAQLAGRSRLPGALPLTTRLTSAFLQRIKRLPESAQGALLVAAAENLGELQIIRSAAAELTLPVDALEPAEQLGIVTTDRAKLTFRHPLIRSAVRIGNAWPAPPGSRGAGRRACRSRSAGSCRVAPRDGDRRSRRGHRRRVGSIGAAFAEARRPRVGGERVRAGG